jgi:serine protease
MVRQYIQRVILVSLALGLAACGGGGDDDTTGFSPGLPPGGVPAPGAGGSSGFVVTGVISVPESTNVDSDVNDPNADYASNDTANLAQLVSNPISLGGYVNLPGIGEDGRSKDSGDVSDFYRFTFIAGQQVTLSISDSAANLDLYLWDETGTAVVDSSMGLGTTESLTVPATDTYLVEVVAESGASAYTLVTGLGGLNAQTSGPGAVRLSDDFVPGQLVVKSAPQVAAGGARRIGSRSVSGVSMSTIAGSDERLMQLSVLPLASQSVVAQTGSQTMSVEQRVAAIPDHSLREKYRTLLAMQELQASGEFAYVEPNYILQPLVVPNDPFYPFQWHYPLINLPAAWDLTTGSSAVTVAVVDTGILSGHPDLQGQLVAGYDFISSSLSGLDGDGIDSNPEDPGDGGDDAPSSFHGTHVAGTIAAASNNGTGVAGVAWGVNIMPLRVLGKLGGTSYDVRQAIRYAAGLSNDSPDTASPPVDVINLSLGGGGFSQADQDVYTDVRNAGVIVIAAAGNSGNFEAIYPAGYEGVVAVSASGSAKQITGYSSRGVAIDVAAPGGDTSIDRNGDGYVDGVLSIGGTSPDVIDFVYPYYQGTSMAAPHVAGVAALMRSVNPALTPADFDALLLNGDLTEDLGNVGRDDLYGYGLIDAQKAVIAALTAIGAPPVINPALSVSPGSVSLGSVLGSVDITLKNVSSSPGSLTVAAPPTVVPAAPWLTITPVNVDIDGLGTYQLTVDRSGLTDGSYATVVSFVSNENTVSVPVIMQQQSVSTGGIGSVYVLLIDDDEGEILDQFSGQAVNGSLDYSFSGLAPGNYSIIAGTDIDNDFVICQSAEACGGYPSLDAWSSVPVTGNTSGLNFFASFAGLFSQSVDDNTGLPRAKTAAEAE